MTGAKSKCAALQGQCYPGTGFVHAAYLPNDHEICSVTGSASPAFQPDAS
jgi:hypothetical protein